MQKCYEEYGIGGIPIVDENQKLKNRNQYLRFEKVNSRPIIE
jgi:IMP dehydrogenase